MLPQIVIETFPPNRLGWLEVIRPAIDDSMLREIAEGDYGDRADAHQAALRPIRDHGRLPERFEWAPGEVLELIRYSDPTDLSWKPGRSGLEGQRMRGFACAALLATEIELGDLDETSLAQGLRCEMDLGGSEYRALAGFLTYAIERVPTDFPWLAASGLLLVALRTGESGVSGGAVRAIAEWIETDEQVAEALHAECEYHSFGHQQGYYLELGQEMRLHAARQSDADLQSILFKVAAQLEE